MYAQVVRIQRRGLLQGLQCLVLRPLLQVDVPQQVGGAEILGPVRVRLDRLDQSVDHTRLDVEVDAPFLKSGHRQAEEALLGQAPRRQLDRLQVRFQGLFGLVEGLVGVAENT